jgi:hypothetical protein
VLDPKVLPFGEAVAACDYPTGRKVINSGVSEKPKSSNIPPSEVRKTVNDAVRDGIGEASAEWKAFVYQIQVISDIFVMKCGSKTGFLHAKLGGEQAEELSSSRVSAFLYSLAFGIGGRFSASNGLSQDFDTKCLPASAR